MYVASSWRNALQPAVVATLRAADIDCYDFKDSEGFHWSEVMPEYRGGIEPAHVEDYLEALEHPRSIQGYSRDFSAMEKADTFILVLPCGRSAHQELGWAVGQGKRTAILLDPDDNNEVTPELMYKMVDFVTPSMYDLLGWLEVED